MVLRAHWSSCVRLLLGFSVWGAEGCERNQRSQTGFVWQWSSDWGTCLLPDKSQDRWFQHRASWAQLIHPWPYVAPHPSSLPSDGICLPRCQTFCAPPAPDAGWEPDGLAAAVPLGDWSYCPVPAGVGVVGSSPPLSFSPLLLFHVLLASMWEVLGRAEVSTHCFSGGRVEKTTLFGLFCVTFSWGLTAGLCTLMPITWMP